MHVVEDHFCKRSPGYISCKTSFGNRRSRNFCAVNNNKKDEHICDHFLPSQALTPTASVNTLEKHANMA